MRSRYNLAIILSIVALLVSTLGTFVTATSLCTFKDDVRGRKANAVLFLDQHPNGGLGFSREQIEKSIHDYDRTIDSFKLLPC